MLPFVVYSPVWFLTALVWPAIQTLHILRKDTLEVKEARKVWLFYWMCFIICSLLRPYFEWLIYLPFYLLSYVVDLYYEAQLALILLLVLPKPLLIENLYAKFRSQLQTMDWLAIVGWQVLLITTTIPCHLVASSGLLLVSYLDEAKQAAAKDTLAQIVIVMTCLAWRLATTACFWLRMDCDGLAVFRDEVGSSGRPCVILPNHVSFVDVIFAVTLMPIAKVGKVRMMVSDHVFKMPLIGRIAQAMGHVSVPFKEPEGESFALDKDVMDQKLREMDHHIASGGFGGWFPEGMLNPGSGHQMGVFRAGGFNVAVKNDVEVWCMASVGNNVFWPRKAKFGGLPCRIGYKFFKVCDSSTAFCAGVAGAEDKEPNRAKAEHLANRAQAMMQAAVDELVSRGFHGAREA